MIDDRHEIEELSLTTAKKKDLALVVTMPRRKIKSFK